MSRIGIGALSAAALALLGGCVDTGGGLAIIQNQVPTIEVSMGQAASCTIPAESSAKRNVLGTYDVALDKSYPYDVYPLISNELPVIMAAIDPNLIEVTRFSVKIEPPPTVMVAWSPACPAEFDFPTPISLRAGEQASAIVQGMRPCHGDLLRQLMQQGRISSSFSEQVIFRLILRAKGRHGSTEIRSTPFEFPVRVCYGCLQTGFGDPQYADFGFPRVPACDKLVSNPFPGNPCNPAQDVGPLLCCAMDAEGKQLECPGIPRGAPPPSSGP
jgi:hypothetical protein